MEIIILGLLMLKSCTVYEMRKAIERNFTNISSNSTGSIQAVIKKLLNGGMIIYTEQVENSVNKKIYQLTGIGKAYFFENVSKSMLYKEKNMELSKLFFMGFAPKEKRTGLIADYIVCLKEERAKLEKIRLANLDRDAGVLEYMKYLDSIGGTEIFAKMLNSDSAIEGVRDIAKYQYATLELSIAKVEFEISWFERFIRGEI